MFLKINHRTRYTYKNPIHSLTQCIKLFPSKHKGIKIINWNVTVKDAVMGAKVIESNGDQSLVSHVSKIKKSSIDIYPLNLVNPWSNNDKKIKI